MLELTLEKNIWTLLMSARSEGYIPNDHQIIYLYDDLSVGLLNVNSLEERIQSMKDLNIDIDYELMMDTYKTLVSELKQHHTIRIWTFSYAHIMIGMYMVCYIIEEVLKLNDRQVYVCDMDIESDNPKDVTSFINHTREINPDDYAKLAKKYIQENSLLRLKLNNDIVSLNIDYFDEILIDYIKQYSEATNQWICDEILYKYMQEQHGLVNIDILLNRIAILRSKTSTIK